MEYKRLNQNISILNMHNHSFRSVKQLTDGKKTENQVIDEIVHDTIEILDKIEQGTLKEIPENAVVLTDKNDIQQYEWSKLVDKMGVIEFGEKTRKETAEKFAERVKMVFYYEFDELIPSIMADKIDEIAKEITEGEQGKLDEQKNCIYEQRKELDFVWWECSACGSGFNFYANTPYENRFHYCPYCGAKIAECKELQNERND